MLLNPADYTYQYFKQPRGTDGLSGPIHIAYPLKDGLCTILVKDHSEQDAINEFLGCNIGQRIGVNTPRAWLFKSDNFPGNIGVNFSQAVGIEYFEGFDERHLGLYETEEKTIQTIKARIFRVLINDSDKAQLACWNGNIYTFDFAGGMYEEEYGHGFLDISKYIPTKNGFTMYDNLILGHERNSRSHLMDLFLELRASKVFRGAINIAYSQMRDAMMKIYAENRFEDLVLEIGKVFSDSAARYAGALIDSTYNMIVDLPVREGEYYKTQDGTILVKEPADEQLKAKIKERANAK